METPARFSVDIKKLILESTWRDAGHGRAETILKTKGDVGLQVCCCEVNPGDNAGVAEGRHMGR